MKNPENMTPDERLKRIRSLERKVRLTEHDLDWATRDRANTYRWAEEAWKEVRRLHTVLEHHWEVRQEARKLAGLDQEDRTTPIAHYDHEKAEWVPVDTTRELEVACPCGMTNEAGQVPFSREWHIAHRECHLKAFPDLDVGSRLNLDLFVEWAS